MKVVGIISEYNPFHQGHAYQIKKAKEITGADYVVVIMNGDFVQRGEPAIFNKYTRTEQALSGGADLVFELPLRFGISSAGDFAYGGVLALTKLGFITHLCFGSEKGEIAPFLHIASYLNKETATFKNVLDAALHQGLSYPAARIKAISQVTKTDTDFLSQPNNILGIEYCLAIQKINSSLKPITILREGAGYHDTVLGKNQYPSATSLREKIKAEQQLHLTLNDFSSAIMYSLKTSDDLTKYKDVSGDIADRFMKNLDKFQCAGQFVELCQTKAFTLGRLRRCLLQILLGLTETSTELPYLRLLGMKKEAGFLLKKTDSFTILSHLAKDMAALNEKSIPLLQKDILASDLYRLTYNGKYKTTLPNEYQHSPIVL